MPHHTTHPPLPPQDAARSTRGFLLLEILIALMIFAIGFLLFAGAIPAGTLLAKRNIMRREATMAANNTVAVLQAKKCFEPVFEWYYAELTPFEGRYAPGAPFNAAVGAPRGGETYPLTFWVSHYQPSVPSNLQRPGVTYSGTTAGVAWTRPTDCEACTTGANGSTSGSSTYIELNDSMVERRPYLGAFDTDGNGQIITNAATGDPLGPVVDRLCGDPGDYTNKTAGKFHLMHNRLNPGALYLPEDRSFPSTTPNLADRRYFCMVFYTDRSLDHTNRSWQFYAAVLNRPTSTADWPEKVNAGNIPEPQAWGTLPTDIKPANFFNMRDKNGYGHPAAIVDSGTRDQWFCYRTGGCEMCDVRGSDTHVPTFFRIPALVQDYDRSILQVCYPASFSTQGDAQGINRRIQVGDQFISRQGGTIFTAIEVQDRVAIGGTTYGDISNIKVYPSLRETPIGPNPSFVPGSWSGGSTAYTCSQTVMLQHVYFAPPPLEGGSSPLVLIKPVSGNGIMTSSRNQ